MLYRAIDLWNDNVYNNKYVHFILGKPEIFRDKIVDNIKRLNTDEIDLSDSSAYKDWGIEEGLSANNQSISLSDFFEVVLTPSIYGKWICQVDYDIENEKTRDKIYNYINNKNSNGILIIHSRDYKNYVKILKDKKIQSDKNISLWNIQFPDRGSLYRLVTEQCKDNNVKIADKAISYFVQKVGNNYDEYCDLLQPIIESCKGEVVTYEDITGGLRGYGNYNISDFIVALTKPIKSNNIEQKRKIYKIYYQLLEEYGIRGLTGLLKKKINQYIRLRMLINKGYIPIKVDYSVEKVKEATGYNDIADNQFKREAEISSMTSLKDWVTMRCMLNNSKIDSDESYEISILSLIHRSKV